MSSIRNLAEALNAMYIHREELPEMVDHVARFTKQNVIPDLIDLGSRINQAKKTHSPHITALSVFFPRATANFKKLDDSIESLLQQKYFKKKEEK